LSNPAAELRATTVVGRAGTGKTTFAFLYLLNAHDVACRFIFDDRGQCADRLKHVPGLRAATTVADLENSLASRWVVFQPWRMFPGDVNGDAFKWFCDWSYQKARTGRGRKIIFVDELWRHCSPNHIPRELATITQEGRIEEIEFLTATQRPHKLNDSVRGQCTELVCFRLQDHLALNCVADLGADADAVANLAPGSFISYALDSGRSVAGKLF